MSLWNFSKQINLWISKQNDLPWVWKIVNEMMRVIDLLIVLIELPHSVSLVSRLLVIAHYSLNNKNGFMKRFC